MKLAAAFPGVEQSELLRGVDLSLLSMQRILSIGECVQATRHVDGDTAEVGTASGGTSKLIALSNGGKTHWACDTFDGLVDVGAFDVGLTNKMFQNTLDVVSGNLQHKNVRLVAGYFPESAPPEMADARFAFVHIDVDTYQSVHNCWSFFAARMAPGGIVVLDDVLPERSGTPGAQKAWREIASGASMGWKVRSRTPPQIAIQWTA